ncbi:MAG: DHH family phosphoesterase [archaeon]
MKIQEFFTGKKGKRLLILTHHNADVDAVASTILLSQYLAKLGLTSVDMAFPGGVSLQARSILPYSKIKPLTEFDIRSYDLVVLVDTATPNQLPGVDLAGSEVVIIDHHQAGGISGKKFVDRNAVSTTSVIHSGFSIPLTKQMAELVLVGIIFDSAFLKVADNKAFSTIAKLLNEHKLNYGEILELLSAPMSESERIARLKGGQRCQIHRVGGFLLVTSEVGSFEASVARALVASGADAAVVGCAASEARISARARANFIKQTKVNLGQQIMPRLGELLGGAGSGHDAAAGANGPDVGKLPDAIELAVKLISEQIKNAKDKPRKE